MHVVLLLGAVFLLGVEFFEWTNLLEQNSVCWPPVGPQDIKHSTYTHRLQHARSKRAKLQHCFTVGDDIKLQH